MADARDSGNTLEFQLEQGSTPGMEEKMDRTISKVDGMEKKLNRMISKIDAFGTRMEERLDAFGTRMEESIDALQAKIDAFRACLTVILSRLLSLKGRRIISHCLAYDVPSASLYGD